MAVQVTRRYLLGELELEPDNHVLKRHGVPVALSKKRFQILLYLIEHREHLVTREELLDRFWDGSEVYEENLTKCISEIRKALGDQKKPHQFIETLPAVGYRYVGPLVEQSLQNESAIFEFEKVRGVKIVVEEDTGAENKDLGAEKIIPLQSPVASLRSPAPKRSSWPVTLILALAFCALTTSAFIVYHYRIAARVSQPASAPIPSIAVLPLKNLTNDAANEYFIDGMTDTLITALSKIEGLKVISRGSVFRFKEQEIDPRDVGKQLGVAAVLEGSMRKEGDAVRVAVRLVSAEDGRVLWSSDISDYAVGGVFALQDEIARDVAAGLKVRLGGEGEQRLTKRYTENKEAYQLYLKGRFFWNKRTKEGMKKAIEFFEQAIQADQNYALAYAGLADSYALINLYSGLLLKDSLPRARAAAERALEIDDTLAEAHTTLAHVKYYYDWDWAGAEREFKRVIELNPNYATAHQWYAEYLMYMERFDESTAEFKRAQELDPLSLVINTELGSPYFYRRQYDQAMEKYQKALEIDRTFPLANYCLALCYEQKSMHKEALAFFGKGLSEGLGYTYAASGMRRQAQDVLDKMMEISKQQYYSPYLIAEVHAGLGEKDEAFAWLEKAYEDRDERMVILRVDPHLDSLRADPRFTELERRMGLQP